MSEVQSLEDLQKKDNTYKHKIKACKSYAALRGMANRAKASSNSCANLNIVAAADGFSATPVRVNKNGYHQ
jgi:sulfur relay (sulfurtransferase) complex TusBCD TusD component (DsrE family)